MRPEVFESSTVSVVLSWLFCAPIIFAIPSLIFSVFAKHKGVPWVFSAWMGVCFLVLSPVGYLLFQVALATSYLVQSFSAFISIFLLTFYVPIVFGILAFIGMGLPLLSVVPILGKADRLTFRRGLAASVVLPVACILCSALFFWALPLAGNTVAWLSVKDQIKATNGPPAFIYKYFTSSFTPTILPEFYGETPRQDIDRLRCHVAAVYVGRKKFGYFVGHQYPEIYERALSESEKD